jgi:hypothetical protein
LYKFGMSYSTNDPQDGWIDSLIRTICRYSNARK